MGEDGMTPGHRPAKKAHEALGLWSIRRALTFAFTAAVILLVAAWFFISWLLGSPSHAKPKPLDTGAQLELLKLVFALVAGVGALVALITAYRRQRVDEAAGERAERIQSHAEYDATERRVTDLYAQAVEQLGHDKAAVRLGGLYSLERLAHDHPQHRQTVTDVVCAYLRMPFQLPPPLTSQGEEPEPGTPLDPASYVARQELQVRLAAQRLLQRHLTTTPPGQAHPATYWDGMIVDLTGAHLVDFDFSHCRPIQATFTDAQFGGDAKFDRAQFSGNLDSGWNAKFDGAHFSRDAHFTGVQFDRASTFSLARFDGHAWFVGVQFGIDIEVGWDARFDGAQFDGDADFAGAHFSENAEFERAKFSGDAKFDGDVVGGTQFSGDAKFDGAQFDGYTSFREAQFHRGARFSEVRFAREPDFADAVVSHPDGDHVWPGPWHTTPDSSGAARLVRRG
ncbi:pentapeptide repeat-containing protein [Actinomadura citrea]|uniref:Uncharacterized protein YjbI with pentapeptide repeats n=1 Tax=Actinomadura citrea TaxID=46158 RepID=A0A7Y9G6V1_9ACTN|nr:pentapeptide repeat-containing protein [Actinomadura citrea]NYE10964.1 uncharacterized protein YjbI with pentapeptide repeats [Actinomadura citrea]GGU07576.1 hypothetical protein GCM10010177_78520 [Actinomadura citrea]